jgi:prephenate dehydratase
VSASIFRPRVAFQGQHGAFSEEAAFKLMGADIELVPRATFLDLFRSIDQGVADYVLAPIENSLVGTIQPCLNLIYRSPLSISGEVIIPIAHHVIGIPGASFAEVEMIASHPVALAQCERFFALHPHIKRVEAEDTAGSVAQVVASGDAKRAAIGGRRAAELYGGLILKENVQDDENNYTRFLLLFSPQSIEQNNDSSLSESDREHKRREALRSYFFASKDRSKGPKLKENEKE